MYILTDLYLPVSFAVNKKCIESNSSNQADQLWINSDYFYTTADTHPTIEYPPPLVIASFSRTVLARKRREIRSTSTIHNI